MRDEDALTKFLEDLVTPGVSNFQASHSTERKSDGLIRIMSFEIGVQQTLGWRKIMENETVGKEHWLKVGLVCMYS